MRLKFFWGIVLLAVMVGGLWYALDYQSEEFCGTSHGSCTYESQCVVSGDYDQVCKRKSLTIVAFEITDTGYLSCYNATAYGLECGCVEGQCQWH